MGWVVTYAAGQGIQTFRPLRVTLPVDFDQQTVMSHCKLSESVNRKPGQVLQELQQSGQEGRCSSGWHPHNDTSHGAEHTSRKFRQHCTASVPTLLSVSAYGIKLLLQLPPAVVHMSPSRVLLHEIGVQQQSTQLE